MDGEETQTPQESQEFEDDDLEQTDAVDKELAAQPIDEINKYQHQEADFDLERPPEPDQQEMQTNIIQDDGARILEPESE